MNKLPLAKRVQVVSALMEGSGVNATARMTGVSKPTILKLVADLGTACAAYHDKHVRGVKSQRVECDEIWAFNYCKRATLPTAKSAPANAGDTWTWTAIDRDSKLIISYLVGGRDAGYAHEFMQDVADRVANRIQLTTDGHRPYLEAVEASFGSAIDYAMLIKTYGETADLGGPERKYSPGVCTGIKGRKVEGRPDARYISTSFVETHNQKIRQQNRRFTRLTAGHSKKIENHIHHLAIYFLFYNFARIHSTVRMSPAMAAGITDRLWEIEDIVRLVD
ncbi:MAG TPA: IS1 family transposase [Rhizomicrobium sp.]|jgi:IS1 family transposase|nr:IS1 family transposase [Rhizomicrobium sp.]